MPNLKLFAPTSTNKVLKVVVGVVVRDYSSER